MAEVTPLTEPEPESLFDEPFNEGLVHQAVVTYEANQRVGLAKTKSRSEVSGRNKKPWRQKGTGRSRHGSRISPLWVGGGRAHGPDGSQDFSKKMTRSMRRKALACALSERCRGDALLQLADYELEEPSTSTAHEWFESADVTDEKVLLLLTPDEKTLRLSTRNLSYCDPFDVDSLNTYQVVAHTRLVFTSSALEALKGRVSNGHE